MEELESFIETNLLRKPIRFIFVIMALFFVLGVIWLRLSVFDYGLSNCIFGLPFLFMGSGLWFYLRVLPKYRTKVRAQIADEHGFEVVPQDEIDTYKFQIPLGFDLFHRSIERPDAIHRSAHTGFFENVIHGVLDNIHVTIFDYTRPATYAGAAGRRRSAPRKYNVVCFQFDEPNLPDFGLHFETIWYIMQDQSKNPDINFEEYPDFSNRYWLAGKDEQTIRQIFTDEVVQHYEHNQQDVSTEANSTALLYYRRDQNSDPNEVQQLMDDGFKILKMFHQELS